MNIIKRLIGYNPYSRPMRKLKEVKGLVVHWIGVPQSRAEVIRNNFENAHGNYASAHYIIDYLTGHIVQAIPDDEVAFHVGANKYQKWWEATKLGNPNNYMVGIECCISDSDKIPVDYANKEKYLDLGKPSTIQYENLAEFCADFLARYKLTIDNLYRHYDITGKPCHLWFYKNEKEWIKFKEYVKSIMAKNKEKNNNEVSEWAKVAWEWCKEKGYLDGTNPKGTVTREMIAQIIFNLFGKG